MTVNIKAGDETEQQYFFSKEGDRSFGDKIPADVYLVLKEKPHKFFKRNGPNLEFLMNISRQEALEGFTQNIHSLNLDQSTIPLKVIGPIKDGSVKRVENQGLPYPGNADKRGDIVVKFEIDKTGISFSH